MDQANRDKVPGNLGSRLADNNEDTLNSNIGQELLDLQKDENKG
jgi:hypothetical protein